MTDISSSSLGTEIGSGFSNGIEGSSNAEEVFPFNEGKTFLNGFVQICYDLCLFSTPSQHFFEQKGRSGAIRMRSGEEDVIGQGSQKVKHGLNIFIPHDSDEKDEM